MRFQHGEKRPGIRRARAAVACVAALGKHVAMWLLCAGLTGLLDSSQVQAAEPPTHTEVWLVTYGPGEIYWQRFGHNAIWIRDPGLGLDHVFNFGFFDFEQKGFLRHFLQGRLMYFSAAQPAQREFAQYIDENRSIRAQRLALTPEQALSLTDYLVNEVQPANREYLYDYYRNNCSTRVRDALDMVLGKAMQATYSPLAAQQNLRDHTRRLTIADYWLYLGLELVLGSPIDRPISRWDEFFIPAKLAEGVEQMNVGHAPDAHPLVLEDVMLYTSSLPKPPEQTAQWWPRYLVLAVAVLAMAFVLSRMLRWVHPLVLARSWLLVSGLLGLALLYLWFFTDHNVARNNLNLALFNPLWLLCWAGRRASFITASLLVGLGTAAVLMTQLPPHQYTADVLAAFLPLNLAAAWVLLQAHAKPDAPGDSGSNAQLG